MANFALSVNAFVLLQLSLILCTAVHGDVADSWTYPPLEPGPHPPLPPPKPPVKPPIKPPEKPPVKPLVKYAAVEGFVYCKPCKYRGVDTIYKASPLAEAVVKLVCTGPKYSFVEKTKTDKKGYFLFMPKQLTADAADKCKVFLVSSPLAKCSVPTNLNDGTAGAVLIPTSVKPPVTAAKKKPFVLYNVGPFAFEPHKKFPCHY